MILLEQFISILPHVVTAVLLLFIACGVVAAAGAFIFKATHRIINSIDRYLDESERRNHFR